MPRAFLIKRYKSAVDYEDNQILSRETSPERGVSTAEGPSFCSPPYCDSETDSIGYENLKPTSPRSPAHESRSQQQSPTSDDGQPLSLMTFHPSPQSTPPLVAYRSVSMSPPITNSTYRPYQSTTSALVTVIRQLMQQQQHQPNIRQQSPDSSPCSTSRSSPILSSSNQQQDSHICNECGKRYSTSSNLARHRQTHRSVTDKKARKCPHCDKVYVSMPAYSMHVRTHSQGCQCPYCGKCFSRPWLLQGHIRTHTGEKPFKCPVCRKAFADKSNLRAHIQTHSSSKPYVCQRCGKAFALKSYLYKHEESSCMRVHRQQQQQQQLDQNKNVILDLVTNKESCDRKISPSALLGRGSPVLVS
ncbi:zinc finger protein SNAI2 [Parasteatoda tepidariorum]|uniref:Transcriptional repressor scratch 1 n=1 Tax=Parasteatoda tepidariorum TaxID=114398 RepID=A0A2L2YAV5_PARTP|nr:zinc finger protein SNAI2 [Parasteatoda tepidariorum]